MNGREDIFLLCFFCFFFLSMKHGRPWAAGGGRKGSPVLVYVCVFVTLVLAIWAVSWLYMGMKVLSIRKQMAEHVNSLTEHVANTAIRGRTAHLKNHKITSGHLDKLDVQNEAAGHIDYKYSTLSPAEIEEDKKKRMALKASQNALKTENEDNPQSDAHQTPKADGTKVDAKVSFDVVFKVSALRRGEGPFKAETGMFTVRFHRDWAPLGVDRVRELVESKFFTGVRFFRVIPNFMAQFGISGDPATARRWRDNKIKDDPVLKGNKRGFVTFATSGKDSRTAQLFINFKDNEFLDGQGFSPVGEVVEGLDEVVGRINSEYHEQPNQAEIQSQGNTYLDMKFPRLTYITDAHIRGA